MANTPVNADIRRVMADINNNLEAKKATETFQAVTFEELFEKQLTSIQGGGTDLRPSKQDKVARLEQDIENVVQQLKELPETAFDQPDEKNVNTPADLVADEEAP